MATHSSILAWRIPWTEEPWRAAVYGVAKSRTRLKQPSMHTRILFQILFHYGFKQDSEYNSLCYTVGLLISFMYSIKVKVKVKSLSRV